MNEKISVFVIFVEAIIYFLLYNLHDCTFNAFQPLTIFAKTHIVTVRQGSEYSSVIINLMPTSATQLYSKTTKINEIFIGTPHFF